MPHKTSATCKKAFKTGALKSGPAGGLYVMKRSKRTGDMYKVYCTRAFRKPQSKKRMPRSLF